MTILFISNEYPPDTGFGGIATYTSYMAEGLTAMGHQVAVICRSVSGRNESFTQSGVTLHRTIPGPYTLPQARVFFPLRVLCYRTVPQSLVRLAWAKSVERKVHSLIRSGCVFDIIEYPECGAEGFFLRHAAAATVARLHTPWELIRRYDDLPGPFTDHWLQNRMERVATRKASAVSSPSHALAQMMKARWRLKQVTVYPNPLPVSSYRPSDGTGWIYTGRIERRKGVDLLIRAYAAAASRQPLPHLTLIGRAYGRMKAGGSFETYLRQLITGLGLERRVTWIPGVSQTEIAGHLARSSAAFFPSRWENFPYACLEAMASGCAVVASRCGGFPEMIEDNVSGLLVTPGDEQELREAMTRLAGETDRARALGRNGRARTAGLFDSAVVCASAERFYRSLIRRGDHA
ncbi:MAG: glycosyltransferase family 4 protein [Chitinispirillaceae bacterium]|nr:glycosyltransferase family 4 protein [Chitinispirillaceae bacterium]